MLRCYTSARGTDSLARHGQPGEAIGAKGAGKPTLRYLHASKMRQPQGFAHASWAYPGSGRLICLSKTVNLPACIDRSATATENEFREPRMKMRDSRNTTNAKGGAKRIWECVRTYSERSFIWQIAICQLRGVFRATDTGIAKYEPTWTISYQQFGLVLA